MHIVQVSVKVPCPNILVPFIADRQRQRCKQVNSPSNIRCCLLVALYGCHIVSFGFLLSVTFLSWTASRHGEIIQRRALRMKGGSRDDDTSSAHWLRRMATGKSVVCTVIGQQRTRRQLRSACEISCLLNITR